MWHSRIRRLSEFVAVNLICRRKTDVALTDRRPVCYASMKLDTSTGLVVLTQTAPHRWVLAAS